MLGDKGAEPIDLGAIEMEAEGNPLLIAHGEREQGAEEAELKLALGESGFGVGTEALAFEHCIVEWLMRHPVRSMPGCGRGDEHAGIVVPFGTEASGHAWLHSECWSAWHAWRRAEAVTALTAMKIGSAGTEQTAGIRSSVAMNLRRGR
jgi:hypothetical protein